MKFTIRELFSEIRVSTIMDGKQSTSENPSASSIGQWPRLWLRADPLPLLLVALVLMCECLWRYRSPTVAMVGMAYYADLSTGFLLLGLFAIARVLQRLARRFYESKYAVADGDLRSKRRFWTWLLAMAAGTFFLVWSQAPMHVSFLLSRPSLDAIASKAIVDPANAHLLANRWAGLYHITDVEVVGSTVVLYLDQKEGRYGFALLPGAKVDTIDSQNAPLYNLDFPKQTDRAGKRIIGDWFVLYSSYDLEKLGWS